MSQATYEQIMAEARLRRHAAGYGLGANLGSPPLSHFIIDVVREGWTPPEPAVAHDLIAAREFVAAECENRGDLVGAEEARSGTYDGSISVGAALAAVLAGKVGIS
jgi:hypothetical protein